MDYYKKITTPEATTEANPLLTSFKITRGYIYGGFLYFPPGSAGLLHVALNVGLHQILPANQGEYVRADNRVLPIDFFQLVDQPPFEITVTTWNESEDYEHSVDLCLFLHQRDYQAAIKKRPGLFQRLFSREKETPDTNQNSRDSKP